MTGTAIETAGELRAVYGLRVVRIPTNRPLRRTTIVTRTCSEHVTVAPHGDMSRILRHAPLHPDVRDAGGLHVILTEYHESRRIDRQLFGRAGRQGDPGSYESIVALDDELFQRFAGKRLMRIVTNGVRLTKKVPPVIGRALKGYSQSRAERLHGRARRMTLAEDHRWNKSSWFRGHGMTHGAGGTRAVRHWPRN